MPEATLLGILLSPLTASITRLHLRSIDGAPLPGAAAASRLAAAMPHLSSLHLEGGAAMAMEAQAAAATSVLLRSLGSNLRTLRLDLHLDPDLLPTPTPTPPQHRQPGTALVLLPADLATSCPALLELRIQLHTRDLGGSQKQQQALTPGAAAIAATTAACFASAISATIASLASLACLELRFPGLALRPDVAAAALPGLAALTRLTKLVLPIRAADPDADASGAPPKSSHVVYGGAVQALLRRLRQRCHCRTPPAPPPTASQQLVELDLGPDLALTLPYLPYTAPALVRLSVGELSAECVSVSQWDVVPEPPPPLPLELLSAVPAELWEPTRDAGRGGAAGGGGESEGGRPCCSLPLSAVRMPPRLQALQVRYMPDVAILAALAALSGFAHLDCTAVRHPQGEICLDLASVGVPGPPDLSGYGGGGAAAAAATAVSCLRGMVAAAAGLLLRVLDESDWRRHPLTLRPSPFSFLRDSYSRLRWSGPHAAWMAAVAPLAGRVTRLRLKQMALQREDVLALAAALPGLESLELVRCAVRRSDLRAWRAALGPGVLEAGGADLPPGGPGDCDDMFGSSSSDSGSSNGSSNGSEGSSGCGSDGRADNGWAML